MIKETGHVVKAEHDEIWVETQVTSTCQTCSAKSNCGTSSLAGAMTSKTVINKVRNHLSAKVGDEVEIGVPEQSLVSGAFMVYVLPLIFALFAAAVAQLWLVQFIDVAEWFVIACSFFGGYLGLRLARYQLEKRGDDSLEPQLLRLVTQNIQVKEIH